MRLKSLNIENIRSHKKLTRVFSPRVTVIAGRNGSGKTSLLESILVTLDGKSFKGGDSDLLRRDAEWWRIRAVFSDEDRIVKFQPSAPKKKQFIINDKTTARIPAIKKYPVVLFEPNDLRLLHGAPSRRRDFIDKFAGQLIPDYSRAIRRYERALQQRNRLLKSGADSSALFAWNVALAKYGAYMIDVRVRLIERLNGGLNDLYKTIAQQKDIVSLHYSHTIVGNTEQKILNDLEQSIDRDMVLGYTSVGPHRHDVVFEFNDMLAVNAASRGEVRTIILALKFLEVDILHEVTGSLPIILLDDVLSELDDKRQSHLVTKFENHQIIITSTAPPKILGDAKVIRLR